MCITNMHYFLKTKKKSLMIWKSLCMWPGDVASMLVPFVPVFISSILSHGDASCDPFCTQVITVDRCWQINTAVKSVLWFYLKAHKWPMLCYPLCLNFIFPSVMRGWWNLLCPPLRNAGRRRFNKPWKGMPWRKEEKFLFFKTTLKHRF